jgi:hypothetical protein
MENEVSVTATYFEPLLDFLSVEGYPSNEVAEMLDELLYDYAQLNLIVQQADLTPKIYVHEKAEVFHYWIKELRDAIKKCNF